MKSEKEDITASETSETPEKPGCLQGPHAELEELKTALKESEAKFRNIVHNAIEGIFQTDPQGRFTHANPSFARIHGYTSSDEIKGNVFARDLFVNSSDHKRLIELLHTSDSVQNCETQLRTKDGKTHWVSMNVMVFRDENGKTLWYEGAMLDITERKKNEEALKESEAKFRNIVHNAIEGIFQTDPQGRFTHANPSFARIHGYTSSDEIKGNVFARDLFVNSSDHKRLIELLHTSDSVQNCETQLRTKDGKTHWVSVNVMVLRDENGKTLRYEGTMLDITERKKTEGALLESEERYRVTVESSNDGISILQGDICSYANKQYIQMFEFDGPEEIVGKSIKTTIHPDDVDMVTDIINRRQQGEPVPSRYEFKGITKKGNVLHVEVSAANITFRGMPIRLLYFRDITERKRAEESLIKSHKELDRLNKAKTKAVNHISHELQTPLAVIKGNLSLLKRKLEDKKTSSDTNKTIEVLERNTERLFEISRETDEIFRVSQEVEAGIVLNELDRLLERMENVSEIPDAIRTHWESLKEWTGEHLGGRPWLIQSVDLYSSIITIVEKMKQTAHRNLHINVEGQNDLFISIDPYILKEVATGLIKNAIENTPDKGTIEVSMEQKDTGILLYVSDRGIGITKENQASLLDGLFHTEETDLYTTKKPFEFGAGGKGLDLLRIKYYAKRYGFNISFESKRCAYIPTDRDICPGDIAQCSYCKTVDDCVASGGTIFTLTFPPQ